MPSVFATWIQFLPLSLFAGHAFPHGAPTDDRRVEAFGVPAAAPAAVRRASLWLLAATLVAVGASVAFRHDPTWAAAVPITGLAIVQRALAARLDPRPGSLARAALVAVLVVSAATGAWAQTPDLVTRARQALDADRTDEALALLERAVAANPNDPAALAWLGSAQVRRARTASAEEAAGGVRKEKDPASVSDAAMPLVYLNLGLAYKKLGQKAEARAAWETGRKLYPSAPEAAAIARELGGL
jgi:tetratricopeptide (TPR) repeat protein